MLRLGRMRATWMRVGRWNFCSELVARDKKEYPLQLYGKQFPFHLLPNTAISWQLDKTVFPIWMKRFPNYLVCLIRNETKTFYDVATYCEISYSENVVSVTALFKTEVTSLAEILDEVEGDETKTEKSYLVTVTRLLEDSSQITHRTIDALKYIKSALLTMRSNNLIIPPFVDDIAEIMSNLNLLIQFIKIKAGDTKAMQTYLQKKELEQRVLLVQEWLRAELIQLSFEFKVEKQLNEVYWRRMFEEQAQDIYKLLKQYQSKKSVKELFIDKCVADFHGKNPSADIITHFQKEMDRFKTIEQSSSEYSTVRKYLEDLSRIPYGVSSHEELDLKYAKEVLDGEHYGLEEVKKSILQVIAVGKLKGSLSGKILCLTGGPGLGKTSIAKSIAKALKRQFFSIPLGGVVDSSVLKGHRRTYVGAYAGKIIEALKLCGTNNPVILLDEIDKMGSSSQGDPRSELLQILDPAQNNAFTDNYIDVPVDLSRVLFICSANYVANVSKPLLDRMERIHLDSYTEAEKLQILSRHLLRRAAEKSGVKSDQFIIQPNVLEKLVKEYSQHEGSVRQLQRHSDHIFEKIAHEIVSGESPVPVVVSVQNLAKFVGPSHFLNTDHSRTKVGVALSISTLHYTSRLTYVEARKVAYYTQGNKGMMFTGHLGKVFQEALKVSYNYVKGFLQQHLNNKVLFQTQVHIHVPEGGSKKDGSTDSLAVALALVSFATDQHIKKMLAVSGELTLQGKILRTRGVKEKVLVARREKIQYFILPQDNQNQIKQLSPELVQGITFHFVRQFSEVYGIAFSA